MKFTTFPLYSPRLTQKPHKTFHIFTLIFLFLKTTFVSGHKNTLTSFNNEKNWVKVCSYFMIQYYSHINLIWALFLPFSQFILCNQKSEKSQKRLTSFVINMSEKGMRGKKNWESDSGGKRWNFSLYFTAPFYILTLRNILLAIQCQVSKIVWG